MATRPDLLDRAIVVTLPTIFKEERRAERELWAEFETKLPGILGALLDAVSAGLKNLPTTKLDSLPRMADFATWVSAAEAGLGWKAGTFLNAYQSNRAEANQRALESSPLALAVWRLMRGRDQWSGTSTQLLEELKRTATKEERDDSRWPRAANSLSAEMNRIAPALREGLGIEYADQAREGKGGRRVKKLSWITGPEKDRQQRQNRQPDEKDLQNEVLDPGSAGDADDQALFADDPLVSADDGGFEGSSANRRGETPANERVFGAADDADGSDDHLRSSYGEESSWSNGSSANNHRLTSEEVLKELNRSGSGAAKQAELYRRGEIKEEDAIEWATRAILRQRSMETEGWQRHAPVVVAALTHSIGCECEECL